jgi:hypothetical protein
MGIHAGFPSTGLRDRYSRVERAGGPYIRRRRGGPSFGCGGRLLSSSGLASYPVPA